MKGYYLPIQRGLHKAIIQEEEPCNCGCTEFTEIEDINKIIFCSCERQLLYCHYCNCVYTENPSIALAKHKENK